VNRQKLHIHVAKRHLMLCLSCILRPVQRTRLGLILIDPRSMRGTIAE
jgi:hypothetical protein